MLASVAQCVLSGIPVYSRGACREKKPKRLALMPEPSPNRTSLGPAAAAGRGVSPARQRRIYRPARCAWCVAQHRLSPPPHHCQPGHPRPSQYIRRRWRPIAGERADNRPRPSGPSASRWSSSPAITRHCRPGRATSPSPLTLDSPLNAPPPGATRARQAATSGPPSPRPPPGPARASWT